MTKSKPKSRKSAFVSNGPEDEIREIIERTQKLYLEDQIPWVIGYSGGKDSTAIVQLVWTAISELPDEKQHKPVHIISTDTLVENPVVALWVEQSLIAMQQAIDKSGLPFHPHRLTPAVQDRFWVNLIGRGYPTPRPKFRWCTSRLKISPSTRFITDLVQQYNEAILVLGTRKKESTVRASNMEKKETDKRNTRKHLTINTDPSMDRVWVYTPISEWSNDDVWEYLVSNPNPWGYDNSNLLGMYRGATKDNECPLVVDSSTPSCGDSRFGCYVCTMVDQDKSMAAMIQNDDEKQWMKPLLDFRNKWLSTNDREHRDFRRMNGSLTVYKDRLVHGPYKQEFRQNLLQQILITQEAISEMAPPEIKGFILLTIEDLEEIRRIWVIEKHEIEDTLPGIFEKSTGRPYPAQNLDENLIFKPDDMAILKEVCSELGDEEAIHYQLARELLHLEQQHRTMVRRKGLYDTIDKALERGAFDNAREAEEFAVKRDQELQAIRKDGPPEAVPYLVELNLEAKPNAF